jgi:hypothetical protein
MGTLLDEGKITMPDLDPIVLRAVDNNSNKLFEYAVPFRPEMTARDVLELAFVMGQKSKPDPFVYTLQYYGYSESTQFPGYLGYELESLAGLSNTSGFFWDLLVDGVSAKSGCDTTFPGPGAEVTWQYCSIPAAPASVPRRAALFQSRQAARP